MEQCGAAIRQPTSGRKHVNLTPSISGDVICTASTEPFYYADFDLAFSWLHSEFMEKNYKFPFPSRNAFAISSDSKVPIYKLLGIE